MVAYVACDPYFDIATGKLANDVPMGANDNNASTSSSGCSPKIEQCCFGFPLRERRVFTVFITGSGTFIHSGAFGRRVDGRFIGNS
jgi:hypothetical protein